MVAPPGPWLMMATPARASVSAARVDAVGRDRAQREGVADRDLALQARRLGASGDCQDLRQAGFAAIVQVDVDADAAALGDGEDRIEMGVEVAVDADRIEAAHEVRALRDRLVEQLLPCRESAGCRFAGRPRSRW